MVKKLVAGKHLTTPSKSSAEICKIFPKGKAVMPYNPFQQLKLGVTVANLQKKALRQLVGGFFVCRRKIFARNNWRAIFFAQCVIIGETILRS